MTDQEQPISAEQSSSAPWHLWLIGIVSLLWNAMGAMDYVMTQTRNEDYMANFTPEQLEFFYGFPAWLVAFWALAVWGGMLGSLLLLLRKALAVPVFALSFVAMLVTTIHNFFLSNGLEVIGDPVALIFSAIIFVVALLLWIYARGLQQKGVIS